MEAPPDAPDRDVPEGRGPREQRGARRWAQIPIGNVHRRESRIVALPCRSCYDVGLSRSVIAPASAVGRRGSFRRTARPTSFVHGFGVGPAATRGSGLRVHLTAATARMNAIRVPRVGYRPAVEAGPPLRPAWIP